ncbi:MAG: glycosyltransferase family 4 protein [Bacteroidia bacterium]|nr:glycosyltransferase family 4 protein [Bacteroidia bacterium]
MAGAPWGGSEELWARSAEYAIEKGHEVIISVYNWGDLHSKLNLLEKKGATIILRKRIFYGMTLFQRAKGLFIKKILAAKEIRKLSSLSPDAIFISQGTIYECMFPEFRDLQLNTNAKTYIITQANSEYETLPGECRKTGKVIFANATKTYFVSERNKSVAERQLALLLRNAEVISNPANLQNIEDLFWYETECLNMAFVGRINSTVKGLGVLFQILGEQKWRDRNWHLNLYGKGEDELYLTELAEVYQIKDKISFKGYANDIREIWKENHLLLMPSTLEGTPLSLIEAMLCERAAVVSDVGGNSDLVKEGLNGFLAEAPSVYSFGNAMNRMWENKSKLKQMGIEGKKLANKIRIDDYKKIIDHL